MDASGDLRVGDRERAEIDARLRAAHDDGLLTLVEYDERSRDCFAARFRRDLDALVVDLPDTPTPSPAPTRAPAAAPTVTEEVAAPAPARSGHHGERRGPGRFVPLALLAVVAVVVGPGVFGADQGAAVFSSRTVTASSGTVEVGVLFGSATVIVPDGTRVVTSGTTIFGSLDCEQACSLALPPGAPQVQVSGRGAFGSVDVETVSEAARGGLDHRDGDSDSDTDDD